MYGYCIRFFYHVGYPKLKQFDIRVVVACCNGDVGAVSARLSFIILFICLLFFPLIGISLIGGSLVGLPAVLSKVFKFLAIIASVIAGDFLLARVSLAGHYCEVSCQPGGSFVDKLGFGGGHYLLYFVNCLITLFEYVGRDGLEVIV